MIINISIILDIFLISKGYQQNISQLARFRSSGYSQLKQGTYLIWLNSYSSLSIQTIGSVTYTKVSIITLCFCK